MARCSSPSITLSCASRPFVPFQFESCSPLRIGVKLCLDPSTNHSLWGSTSICRGVCFDRNLVKASQVRFFPCPFAYVRSYVFKCSQVSLAFPSIIFLVQVLSPPRHEYWFIRSASFTTAPTMRFWQILSLEARTFQGDSGHRRFQGVLAIVLINHVFAPCPC